MWFGVPIQVSHVQAVAQIDFMLRQAQHERKSHMISKYPVRPEVLEGRTVCSGQACRRANGRFGQQAVYDRPLW